MQVAVYINGQTFIGEEGSKELALVRAMQRYADHMSAEMRLPEMQGAEDQAWLQAEAMAARYQGLAHLDSLVAEGIAQWEQLV